MKVIGIFRGFPGLGRVVAGVEILQQLERNYGADVIAVSYMQGIKYASKHLQTYQDILSDNDVSSIGIIPVSSSGESIIDLIDTSLPDIIIVDGEPLLLQTIRLRFPKLLIVTLLNPFDVYNPHNKLSSQLFFNDCYSKADLAVVHGLWKVEKPMIYKNFFYSCNTILRSELSQISPIVPGNKIVCILGGGSVNSNRPFLESTLSIAQISLLLAKELTAYEFDILCGCPQVYDKVLEIQDIPINVTIHHELKSSSEVYSEARLIIARAGRNTISELLHLGKASLLFASNCNIRGSEQKANLSEVEKLAKGNVIGKTTDADFEEILNSAKALLKRDSDIAAWSSSTQEVTRLLVDHFSLHKKRSSVRNFSTPKVYYTSQFPDQHLA